jgi:hypothetical protein
VKILIDNDGALEEGARMLGWDVARFKHVLTKAAWEGDVDRLDELAGCRCCCGEHTFSWCPARLWNGCRGGQVDQRTEEEAWRQHYGMTEDEWYQS